MPPPVLASQKVPASRRTLLAALIGIPGVIFAAMKASAAV
jgi:hypothetical protein